jgi:hypothetical protein
MPVPFPNDSGEELADVTTDSTGRQHSDKRRERICPRAVR